MNWENISLKSAKSFHSLFYCYDENGVDYSKLGINDELKKKGKELANFAHNSIYTHMGWYTGKILKRDIEEKIENYS
jgi:hypothetical protein